MDMTIKKVEESITGATKKDPQLILELVPCLSPMIGMVWPTLKPYVEKLAEKSLGEYTIYDVWKEIYFGGVHLYIGYMVDDKTAYDKGDKVEREFAGYVLVRHKIGEKACHIWQAVVADKFQGTNVMDIGQKYLEEEFKKIGAEEITMSTSREGWHHRAMQIGFKEQFTIYRKSLKG